MPGGAFYVYPNVGTYLRSGFDINQFANQLLEEALVAVVPGPAFGTREHVRFSYAASIEQIEEGLTRFGSFLGKLQAARSSTHASTYAKA